MIMGVAPLQMALHGPWQSSTWCQRRKRQGEKTIAQGDRHATSRPDQIPPDLVVKLQIIDIADVIFSPIWRRHLVHIGGRNRKSRCEPLSPSAAHRFTTKSGCAVKASWRNVARPERMQVRSEPLELSCADHSAR